MDNTVNFDNTILPDGTGDGAHRAALAPGDTLGQYKIIRLLGRGGSWFCDAWCCRSAFRNGFTPDFRDYILGFRLMRAVP